MSQGDPTSKRKVQAGLGVLAVAIVIVGTALATSSKSTASTNNKVSTATSNSVNTTTSNSANVSYKNGSYSAYGIYYSPGGQESIKINMTLNNGVVVATSAESGANDPTASSYQSLFISGYKSQIVGKKLKSIKLSNVSGSSLTSQGFNDALKQIENQAKV